MSADLAPLVQISGRLISAFGANVANVSVCEWQSRDLANSLVSRETQSRSAFVVYTLRPDTCMQQSERDQHSRVALQPTESASRLLPVHRSIIRDANNFPR